MATKKTTASAGTVPANVPEKNEHGAYSLGAINQAVGNREFIGASELCRQGPFFIVSMSPFQGGKFGAQILYGVEWRDPEDQGVLGAAQFTLSDNESRAKVYELFTQLRENDPEACIGPVVMTTKKLSGSKRRNPMYIFREVRKGDYERGLMFGGSGEGETESSETEPAEKPARGRAKKA